MSKVICHDVKGNQYEFDSSDLVHRPSVYGILIEAGKVLLSKQWDGYDFPGGGVELGESLEQALERECWEETGLKIKVEKLLYCRTSFYAAVQGKPVNATLVYFLVKKVGGELSVANADELEKEYIDMPEWIELKDLDKIIFYNGLEKSNLVESYNKLNSLQLIKEASELLK